ncbi:AAA domain (dynein-related subfamily) [Bacillus sp. bc15]|uniref:AAA family ATPase n=1 Tax=Bacillus sp. bc15 TaxID=1761758 RepID=UPI000912CBC7|nr:AAA family ATPase [Bacillus sp. bc15]SHL25393.1 AAA domain (dynein-related subfamily) [Bacillus sp. bc15]
MVEQLQREQMNLLDYLEKPYEERSKFWEQFVGNSDLRLFGKVHSIKENNCEIINPRIIDNNKHLSPLKFPFGLNYKTILGTLPVTKELIDKKIVHGDYVFFNLDLYGGKRETEPHLIKIKKDTVMKAELVDGYLANLLDAYPEERPILNDCAVDTKKKIAYLTKNNKHFFNKLIEYDIQEKRKVLAYTEDLITAHQGEISILKEDYERIEEDLKQQLQLEQQRMKATLQQEIDEMEEIRNNLEIFRLFTEKGKSKSVISREKTKRKFDHPLEMIEHVKNYLLTDDEKPLYFDTQTLLQFYTGLRTDQLVVLAGRPGTGKTSLVEGFSKAVDAELRIIPVQPNWMDKSDLLGFLNPIEKTYVSTPFLDAILEAKNNPSKLYFICLDEMNLAHIEYYFAEFLSKLQTDRKIQLYSENIKLEIEEELSERYVYFQEKIADMSLEDFLASQGQNDINNYFQMKKQFHFIHTYQSVLEISENVRFIGTINKDETTKDLSPKVVDRSFLMKIDPVNEIEMEKAVENVLNLNIPREQVDISTEDFRVENGKKNEREKKKFHTMKEQLRQFDLHLTNRFDRAVNQMIGAGVLESADLIDIVSTSLILPKINTDSYDTDLDQLMLILQSFINESTKRSYYVLNEMKIFDSGSSNKLSAITYWR